ncbi:MAG: TonB-dependent receptor [Hyphomonadaceae bacterium]|nr:TonB-dependent receptor [Hyphomonadaceae bacterium]
MTIRNSLLGLLATTTLPSSGVAYAQVNETTVEDNVSVRDTIIVTGRLREENALDVPLTATVFSGDALEDARIDRVDGFIGLTPNVTLATSQSAGISFLTIRGITQVRNGEPPVATVVDGVIQINNRQFTQELFDIQSIEVVKGPQGALFGRNATGGAIIINTKGPSSEFGGDIRLGIGEGDEYIAQGSISGPIVKDRLFFRAALRYRDFGGVFENQFLNQKIDFTEEIVGRGRLLWTPTDKFTADARISIARQEGGGVGFQYQPALYGPDGLFLVDATSFASYDFSIGDADLVDRNFRATNLGQGERNIDEYTLKLDHETGWATLTSISSYNEVFEGVTGDQFPYTADLTTELGGGGGQSQVEEVSAWSQEFRITSPGNQRFRWQLGSYFLGTDRFISTTTSLDTGQGLLLVFDRPLTDPGNPTETFTADDNDNFAWAVFGNIAYDITDNLEFALAGRFDRDRREQTVSPFSTEGLPGAVNEATFEDFQPRVSLRYRFTDDFAAFASWGRGFRSGQFNQNGVAEAAAGAGIAGVNDIVPEENTETAEIGFKAALWGGRVRTNGALFRTELTNQQYFLFVGQIGAQILVPIEEVEILGGEFDITANLADGFDVYAAVGVTDGEVKEYGLDPAAVGNVSPYTPDYTLNLGAQYRESITSGLLGFARVDYERRGRQYWDPGNTTSRSQLDLVNLRFGIEDADERWSLTATIENLTDKEYNSEWVLGGFAHPAPPQFWHVDLRYKF